MNAARSAVCTDVSVASLFLKYDIQEAQLSQRDRARLRVVE